MAFPIKIIESILKINVHEVRHSIKANTLKASVSYVRLNLVAIVYTYFRKFSLLILDHNINYRD